ncbi:MAG TPA: DegV family protein [Dehalococcoidia bacterium]|nr:DegV family protein [Dehalococcoidia bacterium]
MAVRIVTDSTADMSPHLARELGVSVVPLSVIFGDEVFKEGIQIGHDLFYDKLVRSKVLPTTSAPSVGDFLEVYEPLLAETDEIVSIHLSSKLSATYNNALQAAQQLSERGARIEVVDSQLVSLGMSFVVAAAARAATGGAGCDEIKTIVEGIVPRVRILVVLDTLEYVRRGGRIGRARAFLGNMLRVKPLLYIRDGEVHPGERVRTKAQALERVFQIVTSYPRVVEAAVAYSTNPQEAEEVSRRLREAMPGVAVSMARLGPVIGVHGGPGVLGVGVLEGEE